MCCKTNCGPRIRYLFPTSSMGPTKSSPLSQCPLAEAVALGEGKARWKTSNFRGFKVLGRSPGLRSKLAMLSWCCLVVKVC